MSCACGCGGRPRNGRRFVHGHNARLQKMPAICHVSGPRNHSWKGGRYERDGYVRVLNRKHPRATTNGYVREHILVVEAAMGRPLPEGAEVHHVNGNRADNRQGNLVVCPSRAYHMLLERRTRALAACGNPGHMKCQYCQRWDDPANLYVPPNGRSGRHRECFNEYRRERGRW